MRAARVGLARLLAVRFELYGRGATKCRQDVLLFPVRFGFEASGDGGNFHVILYAGRGRLVAGVRSDVAVEGASVAILRCAQAGGIAPRRISSLGRHFSYRHLVVCFRIRRAEDRVEVYDFFFDSVLFLLFRVGPTGMTSDGGEAGSARRSRQVDTHVSRHCLQTAMVRLTRHFINDARSQHIHCNAAGGARRRERLCPTIRAVVRDRDRDGIRYSGPRYR